MEFDFDTVELNEDKHIPLAQFLQIHSVFLKQTVPAQLEDGYRDKRRKCHLNWDFEGYRFYVLKQLAQEAEEHEEVVSNLKSILDGFQLKQYEIDRKFYKKHSIFREQIHKVTHEVYKHLYDELIETPDISREQCQEMLRWRDQKSSEIEFEANPKD